MENLLNQSSLLIGDLTTGFLVLKDMSYQYLGMGLDSY
jgi:hypothetical protein